MQDLINDMMVTPEQAKITPGSYFARWENIGDQNVFIFCKSLTLDEAVAEEVSAGADPHEAAYYRRQYTDKFGRGLRYGNHFSVITPDGEWGSTHIGTCWPITEEDFNEAKANGWTPSEVMVDRMSREIVESMKEMGR